MSDRQLKGIGVSPGIGVGAAIVVRWTMPEVPHRVVPRSQVEKEVRRLRAAVKDVKRYLQDMRAKAEDRAGVDEARIFDAQILMLEDKEFLSGVADLIRENHLAAEKAYEFKALEVRDMWAATGSPRLKDRLADLSGVAVRVIEHLMHRGSDELWESIRRPSPRTVSASSCGGTWTCPTRSRPRGTTGRKGSGCCARNSSSPDTPIYLPRTSRPSTFGAWRRPSRATLSSSARTTWVATSSRRRSGRRRK